MSQAKAIVPEQLQREDVARQERLAAALQDTDTQLMLAVRDGDQHAANTLIRRNFSRVLRFVTRVVRDPRAAEDLTQDVFLQIIAHCREFEPRAKFSTWLYRIATNRALNYLKHVQVRKQSTPPARIPETEIVDLSISPPDERMNLDELRNRVSGALGGLPPNQRIALTLFEYESLSYEQIAGVLDVTIEAVRCLLTRARATLREELIGLL